MKENPLQYRVRATPVPTTRTRGTNYPESTKIGPATRKVIEELISAKAIPAQAYQSCRNVLNMGKHANKVILEQACARLIAPDGVRRAVSYTAVKNMMALCAKTNPPVRQRP